VIAALLESYTKSLIYIMLSVFRLSSLYRIRYKRENMHLAPSVEGKIETIKKEANWGL